METPLEEGKGAPKFEETPSDPPASTGSEEYSEPWEEAETVTDGSDVCGSQDLACIPASRKSSPLHVAVETEEDNLRKKSNPEKESMKNKKKVNSRKQVAENKPSETLGQIWKGLPK